jgi:thiamine-monophosphate kinase
MSAPIDEFDLIARFFEPLGGRAGSALRLGIGDDAALLALPPDEVLVVSVDTVVAGVHFPEGAAPADIGYRALAVAASDLAAMGADPLACTLALTLPAVDAPWLAGLSRGLGEAIDDFALPLVGGDTTRGAQLVLSLQVFGCCPEGGALRRDGARPGDQVLVSGTLGDGAAALAMLGGQWQPPPAARDYLYRRFYRPASQLALGRALRGIASSAIDVSDGLLADLGHICRASAAGMRLSRSALPLSEALSEVQGAIDWALYGGDDYRLAFTLPGGLAAPPGCYVIGDVVAGDGLSVDGAPVQVAGYRHF